LAGAKAPTVIKPAVAERPAVLQRRSVRRAVKMTYVYITLALGMILIMLPFGWLISSSIKDPGYFFTFPPQWTPVPLDRLTSAEAWADFLRLENYVDVFMGNIPFALFIRNSAVISVLAVTGTVLSSSIVAYSFARLRWPGRDVMFIIVLATLMLPSQVTIIPTFIIFRNLGWLDTWWPLVVPYWFGGAFYIFLMRQFFMTISLEMDDAAKIDGCGVLSTYFRILLPLSLPVHGTVAIFSFVYHWNDFFHPLIYLNDTRSYTVALGVRTFRDTTYTIQWHLTMAAAVVAVVPIIVVFFFAQRYFIQGIVFTGVKG
jgi:ABC-type glycerol-3-phosphate transport system permease component